eukprot:8038444-Pyramimonas_sp.AAC.1
MLERTINAVERIYCMAYRTDPGNRRRFMGGGQGCKLEESDNRSKGERSVTFKDKSGDRAELAGQTEDERKRTEATGGAG